MACRRCAAPAVLGSPPPPLSACLPAHPTPGLLRLPACSYVYSPLESSLYLVLITNRGSNIVEDLDTLRLLGKLLPDQMAGAPLTEEGVASRAFELIFALDEAVAAGGFREEASLHAIRGNLAMESHEEKLAAMIKASKMAQAKARCSA